MGERHSFLQWATELNRVGFSNHLRPSLDSGFSCIGLARLRILLVELQLPVYMAARLIVHKTKSTVWTRQTARLAGNTLNHICPRRLANCTILLQRKIANTVPSQMLTNFFPARGFHGVNDGKTLGSYGLLWALTF